MTFMLAIRIQNILLLGEACIHWECFLWAFTCELLKKHGYRPKWYHTHESLEHRFWLKHSFPYLRKNTDSGRLWNGKLCSVHRNYKIRDPSFAAKGIIARTQAIATNWKISHFFWHGIPSCSWKIILLHSFSLYKSLPNHLSTRTVFFSCGIWGLPSP